MKSLIAILLPCALLAQEKEDLNVVQGHDLLMSRKATSSMVVDGSPYIQKDYVAGRVSNSPKSHLLRYNAYSDEMEFKQDNQVLISHKVPDQKFILENNKTYVLKTYSIENSAPTQGYLVELVSEPAKFSLYKKEHIKKVDALEGLNSYQSSKNSYYEKQKDVYLILHEGQYYTVPNSLRKIEQPYKDFANAFNKKNNFKLTDDGLTEFVTWLNKN